MLQCSGVFGTLACYSALGIRPMLYIGRVPQPFVGDCLVNQVVIE